MLTAQPATAGIFLPNKITKVIDMNKHNRDNSINAARHTLLQTTGGEMNKENLTTVRLKEVLEYDKNTGLFVWKKRPRVKHGRIAGSKDGGGYVAIVVDGVAHKAHRLAWLFENGNFPSSCLDHINGVKDDNRISNLREASNSENQQNRDSRLGTLGTSWHKRKSKWIARIRIDRRFIHLGYFSDREDAHKAYIKAKKEIHLFQPITRDKSYVISK